MTDRLTMLLAAQFADHTSVETGPTVVTSSGLHATRFDDGAVAIVLDKQDGPASALHLSCAQADELARYFRTLRRANEPQSILDEAREIVAGARRQTHGEPERNSEAIALVWSALLVDVLQPGAKVSPALVNLMMAGMKLVRAAKDPAFRDHHLDAIGYLHLNEVCGYVNPK